MAKPLHIFRSGTYTDANGNRVTISAAEAEAVARAYDPAVHQAPIVVGHPQTNSPAFGWIAALAASAGAGCPADNAGCVDLDAMPADVDPAFAAAVRERRYARISASFWRPDSPGNPKPGVWYLRHVGFLGGAAPAVPGLRGADLAADAADTFTAEASAPADFATGDHDMADNGTQGGTAADTADFAARKAELEAMDAELKRIKAELDEREQAIARKEGASRNKEIADFADRIIADNNLADAPIRPRILAVLQSIPAEAPVVEFAAGNELVKEPQDKLLRELIEALADPKNRVDFSEYAKPGEKWRSKDEAEAAEIEAAARTIAGVPEPK